MPLFVLLPVFTLVFCSTCSWNWVCVAPRDQLPCRFCQAKRTADVGVASATSDAGWNSVRCWRAGSHAQVRRARCIAYDENKHSTLNTMHHAKSADG